MTSIFQAGQPFNIVRTSSTTYQANDKDLVISSGDEVALPSPDQGATVLVRPAPSIGSVKITTSNGTIGNTGETFGIYRATEPIYLVGDGTDWYARSGGGEISAIPDSAVHRYNIDSKDSASIISDKLASLNLADNNGVSIVSGESYNEGYAVDVSGGSTRAANQGTFPTFIDTSSKWTIAFTIDLENSTLPASFGEIIFTVISSSGSEKITIGPNADASGQLATDFDGGGYNVQYGLDMSSYSGLTRVAFAFDGPNTTHNEFINGMLVSSGSGRTQQALNMGDGISVGAEAEGSNGLSDGRLDDIILYNTVLSSSEATVDYNSQPWS